MTFTLIRNAEQGQELIDTLVSFQTRYSNYNKAISLLIEPFNKTGGFSYSEPEKSYPVLERNVMYRVVNNKYVNPLKKPVVDALAKWYGLRTSLLYLAAWAVHNGHATVEEGRRIMRGLVSADKQTALLDLVNKQVALTNGKEVTSSPVETIQTTRKEEAALATADTLIQQEKANTTTATTVPVTETTTTTSTPTVYTEPVKDWDNLFFLTFFINDQLFQNLADGTLPYLIAESTGEGLTKQLAVNKNILVVKCQKTSLYTGENAALLLQVTALTPLPGTKFTIIGVQLMKDKVHEEN